MPFLAEHEMLSAEFAQNVWTVTVPPGTKVEDLEEPIFWTNVAVKLRMWDELRCHYRHSDGMWMAKFIVTACDDEKRTWAKIKRTEFHKLVEGSAQAVPAEPMKHKEFEVKLRGPQGWSVVRKVDGKIMMERGKLPEDANYWIRNYEAKVAA